MLEYICSLEGLLFIRVVAQVTLMAVLLYTFYSIIKEFKKEHRFTIFMYLLIWFSVFSIAGSFDNIYIGIFKFLNV